jgi:hypothetical protein
VLNTDVDFGLEVRLAQHGLSKSVLSISDLKLITMSVLRKLTSLETHPYKLAPRLPLNSHRAEFVAPSCLSSSDPLNEVFV